MPCNAALHPAVSTRNFSVLRFALGALFRKPQQTWGTSTPSNCIYLNSGIFVVSLSLYEFWNDLLIAWRRRCRRRRMAPLHASS
jgi:hypothetical protein